MQEFFIDVIEFIVRVALTVAFAFAMWGFDHWLTGDGYDLSADQVFFIALIAGFAWNMAADDEGI